MTPQDACRLELQQLQTEIDKLEQERNAHTQKATEYQKMGDNWQFRSGQFEDARKNWNMADDERLKAQDIQSQIEDLQNHKARILQFYPELGQ